MVVKKKSIPKALRMKLWEEQIGDTLSGYCFTCCRIVRIDDFQAGHIIAEVNGGQLTLSNLKVICKPCNTSCGTMNLNDFKELLETQNDIVPSSKPVYTPKAQQRKIRRPYVKKQANPALSTKANPALSTKVNIGPTKLHSGHSTKAQMVFGPNTDRIISAIGINYGHMSLKW
jgi:hypothetical protein